MGLRDFPKSGALLAFDVSKRRIGLAACDPSRLLVTPIRTVERRTGLQVPDVIVQTAKERSVVGLVVGWPLNMDGSEGPACQSVKDMVQPILDALDLPVHFQDERLTSSAVGFAILEGKLPKPKKGEPLDHYAAAVILEDALRTLSRVG